MENETTKHETRWHRLLGKLLEGLLTPVGISVYTEVPVMSDPPKADILLLTKETKGKWTPEQMERLPDGIREKKANHILLEFKHTESLSIDPRWQTGMYERLYKSSKGLKKKEARIFVISSKKPRKSTLEKFGYCTTDKKGVYSSVNVMLESIILISLNDLANTPHNAYIKCFASRKKERVTAFNIFHRMPPDSFSSAFKQFMAGLYGIWFTGGDNMDLEITPEHVEEMGRIFGEHLLSSMPLEKKMKGIKPKEILSMYKPEEILSIFEPEELQRFLDKLQFKKQE